MGTGGGERGTGPLELTKRQAQFVEEYLLDSNATQAAVRAGYSVKSASQLGSKALRMPQVQAALEMRRADLTLKSDVDAGWVLQHLRMVAERCLQSVPVTDRSGHETGEWSFNATGALRALELLGKHLGMSPSGSMCSCCGTRRHRWQRSWGWMKRL